MMRHRLALRFLAAAVVAGAISTGSQPLFAQGRSPFTGSGLATSSTGGISGSLGASGFGKAGGSGGAAAGGMSGLGGLPSAFGGTGGTGGSGFGVLGAQGAAGAGAANSGFAGRTTGGFAGNSRAGQTGAGAARGGNTRNFSRTGGSSANNNQRNSEFANGAGNERKTSTVRPRQRVAFDYNAKSATTVAANVTTRLDRIALKNPSLKGVDVRVEDNQIVLVGKVQTAKQARLAEDLLRLEPGVKSIRNDLEVEQPDAEE
ncbi:MAG: BON domain-containing protein [Planctomycetota bacterium]